MRPNPLQHRGSAPARSSQHARRAFRPLLEQLETRVLPSSIPTISFLNPNTAVEGSSPFTLEVFGSDFVQGATVRWTANNVVTSLATTFDSSNELQASVPASLLVEESNAVRGMPSITVFQTDNGVGFTSNALSFTITEAPLSATGGTTFLGVAGQPLGPRTVAMFTDSGGAEPLSDYSASIDWGDSTSSTAGIITGSSNGVFTVTGNHTYATGGTFSISVTIFHETASPVTVANMAMITPTTIGGPTITSLSPNTAVEGSGGFTLIVNGFNFVPGATVQWTTTTGGTTSLTTAFDNSNKLQAFVPASLLTEESNSVHGFQSVTVFQNGLTSNGLPFTITETPIFATGGFNISGTAGQGFTTTVATFTDSGGTENPFDPGDYSASINWGDSSTSSGSISLSNNVFSVTGSHTYSSGGTFTVSVAITHETAPTVTVFDTASISPFFTSPTITSLSPTSVQEGSANFTLTASGSGFVSGATVRWTENGATTTLTPFLVSSSQLLVVVPSSLLSVGHAGTVSVTVVEVISQSTVTSNSATFTITPVSTTLMATGLNITATVNLAQDFTVAQFTDLAPNAQTGAYGVPIDFGDGTPLQAGKVTQPGGPGTPFFVDATHTYTKTGTFTVHVRIFKEVRGSGETFSTATVGAAGAPHAPGGRSSSPGRGTILPVDVLLLDNSRLLGMTGVQGSTGQRLQTGAIMASPNATSAVPLAQASASVKSGQPSPGADTYWQILSHLPGDRITDPNGWAADELALALQGTAR